MVEGLLGKAAFALCKALHKAGPQLLGQEIAGIVEKHSIGAAAAGLGVAWLPGAGATAALAASAGFVWSMYFRINSRIGVPFSKNILKSVGTAIAANLVASVVSSIVVGSVLSFIPGIGNLAASVLMAGVSFALTWSCGLVYLKVLTRFAEANVDFNNVSEEDLAEIEASFYYEDEPVEISYTETEHGTKLLVAKYEESNMVIFSTLYEGYEIEFMLTNVDATELTDEEIATCIKFLSDLDFVAPETPAAPETAEAPAAAETAETAETTETTETAK